MDFKKFYTKLKQSQPIDQALVNTLYGFSTKSQITALGFSIFTVLFLYSELSTAIIVWGIGLFSFSLFRLYTYHIFTTQQQRYPLGTWYKIFMVSSLATAILVSLLGSVYIYYLDEYYQLFVIMILMGTTSVSTTALVADYRIAISYISIILLPLIFSMFLFFTLPSLALSMLVTLLYSSQIFMILYNRVLRRDLQKAHQGAKAREEENKLLLEENTQFIADMVHQIKTPLTVIMTNADILEMESSLTDSPNIRRINSAINTLSNSYEDLSYVIANESIEYDPVSVELKEFLSERIDYFSIIAETKEQKFISEFTQESAWIEINDIELERIIDNNLSNAIKYSIIGSEIRVVLEKRRTAVILKFISKGNTIKNVSRVFDKNYTESHRAKRSLGLGLNMVKHICQKNNVDHSAYSMNGTNIFTYVFKI